MSLVGTYVATSMSVSLKVTSDEESSMLPLWVDPRLLTTERLLPDGGGLSLERAGGELRRERWFDMVKGGG